MGKPVTVSRRLQPHVLVDVIGSADRCHHRERTAVNKRPAVIADLLTSRVTRAATRAAQLSRSMAANTGSAATTLKAGKARKPGPKSKPTKPPKPKLKRPLPTSRMGKYNAAGRFVGAIWCASNAEALRLEQLQQMLIERTITDLEVQPSFRCMVAGKKICDYRADFRYWVRDPDSGHLVRSIVEDVKGMITPVFRLKRKLVEALFVIEICLIPGRDVPKWAGIVPS